MQKGLTFDDVLLIPRKSDVSPNDAQVSQEINGVIYPTPIVGAAMDTTSSVLLAQALHAKGGIATIHRNQSTEDQVMMVKESDVPVWAAVGVGLTHQERARALLDCGNLRGLVVDSAHGHSTAVIKMVEFLGKTCPKGVVIVGGNVTTALGAVDLIEAGANMIKVGQGPGAACTTRLVAGIGVPQFTAIKQVSEACDPHNVPVIADGGIRSSGDIVKALAIGADLVMVGSLLAGTHEAPGATILVNGTHRYKEYRGMGSEKAMGNFGKDRYGERSKKVFEGVAGKVKYQGTVSDLMDQLVGGVQVGMGYLGAPDLRTLRASAEYMEVSPSSYLESHPHSMIVD